MTSLRNFLRLTILISITWNVYGLSGYLRGQSMLHREPPIFGRQRSTREVTLHTIQQRVDNFDPQNNATYEMRYYRNDEFFTPGSPIFIYVGGEWSISPGSLRSGGIYDLAKEFNGQLYYTEHRYYGRSYPTPDASTENLRFLSIDQALADLAYFIVEAKKEPGKEKSPVIIVGGSYSATMVTWFRQKYPHLAIGAWSSSAPLFAKLDFIEYKEVVGAAIQYLGGSRCSQLLENAFRESENLLERRSFDEFRDAYGLCDTFDGANKLDVWTFFNLLTDIWAGYVQYHSEGEMDSICSNLINLTENHTDFQAFSQWFRDMYGLSGTMCIDVTYENDVKELRETEWGSSATQGAGKQWFYQTCTEFGWFQTSGSQFQPFGSSFPVDLYYHLCHDVYGVDKERMEQLINRKNTIYGGWNPEVENVFFTHGHVDPWRTMGVQNTLNEKSPATVILDASHCQDLSSISSYDNFEMVGAKTKVKELVRKWIMES